MRARVLMVVGASSSAGKSLLVTALCRLYARRGRRVAPFKAQNMSNNAAVCAGGEIGRAQAVQAHAAGLEPHVDMNPILIKPEADSRSQVVVRGQAWRTLSAGDYYKHKAELWQAVTAGLDSLRAAYDLVIMEGAGSPAELNLKAGDIVNMAVARYASAPALLVGDVDRGGIFAQLLGTWSLLEPDDRALLKGFVINKFRGDPRLFDDGVRIIEERSGLPVLGVVPYLHDHGIAAEDAVTLEDGHAPASLTAGPSADAPVDIAVIRLPRISNFDDFDPLALEPGVRVRYVDSPEALGRPQAVILPGTKSTLADLAWLYERGLSAAIRGLARQGAAVVGICGGYQMLGQVVRDPERVESDREAMDGLGLLPVETVFAGRKAAFRSRAQIVSECGFLRELKGQPIDGYEIHMGRTAGAAPAVEIVERAGEPLRLPDGAASPDGRVFGVYLHGLFDNDNFRRAWLRSLGAQAANLDFRQMQGRAFDRLADAIEASLDLERLDEIIGNE
jgi:adenosylcobyric acid synthase